MTELLTITPLSREDIKIYAGSYSVPTNSEEFERFSIVKKTYEKKWHLQLNEEEKDFLEVAVFDGHRKKNIIQLFTKAIKTVGCTCAQFHSNHLGFCEHLALIERLRKGHINQNDEKTWHKILKRFNLLPTVRNQYRGRAIRVFKPYEQEYYVLGNRNSEVVEESVGCPVVSPIDYEKRYYDFLASHKIVSDGLLNGVKLYSYQEEIFGKMLAAKRCICSMIMGSGKTITSIAAFEWLRKHKNQNIRKLIVAPKSLKLQWGDEIRRCIGLTSIQINNMNDLIAYENGKHQIAIVTYQFATRHIERFKKIELDMIIFDEIQFVRNDETKVWKAMSELQAEFMFGLSGTVIENRLEDLYSVMEILVPGFLGPKWKFSTEYQNISVLTKNALLFQGTKNIGQLRDKLKTFLFSYHKLTLPEIHHQYHDIPLSSFERSHHDEYYEQAKILMSKMLSSGLSPTEKLFLQALLLKSRQCTDTEELITKNPTRKLSGKLTQLMSLLEEICVYRKEKIVIFSSWTQMLDIINREVKSHLGLNCVFFTGEQSLKARKEAINKFVNDDSCQIFLATDAGGLGVDGLQFAATNVVHFELPWNPAKIDQRNARIHRIGQTKEVFCHYFVGEDSVETQMMKTLYNKREIRNEVLYADVPEPIKDKPVPAARFVQKPQRKLTPMF